MKLERKLGLVLMALLGAASLNIQAGDPSIFYPIKDWTGNGTIDYWDRLYYNTFLFDPAVGYYEWPGDRFGNPIYSTAAVGNCCACHENMCRN